MSIGLQRGKVTVTGHKAEWDDSAREIIAKLKDILKDDMIDAQHIGSTSIKSICAKPIVDVVVGVRNFNDIFKHNEMLQQNGIFYRRQDHPGQHLYLCGDLENNIHTHYIHVVIWGNDAWHNYINLRDYLNAHKEKAEEYSALKEGLAVHYADDRIAYTDGKKEFIEEILKFAREWRIYEK